jgi:hypothetical protein
VAFSSAAVSLCIRQSNSWPCLSFATYRSSTSSGGALKDVRSATLTDGTACAPKANARRTHALAAILIPRTTIAPAMRREGQCNSRNHRLCGRQMYCAVRLSATCRSPVSVVQGSSFLLFECKTQVLRSIVNSRLITASKINKTQYHMNDTFQQTRRTEVRRRSAEKG